jgi:TonB family protein
MIAANVLAYLAQVTIVVLVCAGLPRLLGLRSPGVHYAFWRTVLLVCLLLPVVQPWQAAEMTFVPAPAAAPVLDAAKPEREPAPGPAAATVDWFTAAQIAVAAGIVMRLAWLALGALRLRRLRRRATDAAIGFDDLKAAIGTAPPILWSSDVPHPVTFGVFRPVVLLPAAIKAIDLPAQRAIVAHELHHVRRRDWCWVIAEEVLRSVFWFHPAMWWLVSRVQLARETVVDELSILATNARRTYLDTLLAFADDTGLSSSPAFSARRHLFHRVMLLSKEGGMSSFRIAVTSCALLAALAAGSWSAVNAFPLYGAAVQGQAHDSQYIGHRITVDFEDADLRAVLSTLGRGAGLTINLDPQVQARVNILLRDVPWDEALDRILRANKLVYTVEGSTLRIGPVRVPGGTQSREETDRLRQTLMARRGNQQPAAGGSVMEFMPRTYKELLDELKPTRLGGEIKPPMKVYDVKPAYPPAAQADRIEGVVIVEAILDANGRVADARVLKSIPLLDDAALEAVRQWQFEPPLVDGQPRAVLMTTTVNFRLQ